MTSAALNSEPNVGTDDSSDMRFMSRMTKIMTFSIQTLRFWHLRTLQMLPNTYKCFQKKKKKQQTEMTIVQMASK